MLILGTAVKYRSVTLGCEVDDIGTLCRNLLLPSSGKKSKVCMERNHMAIGRGKTRV
jgi:hypothetical protein